MMRGCEYNVDAVKSEGKTWVNTPNQETFRFQIALGDAGMSDRRDLCQIKSSFHVCPITSPTRCDRIHFPSFVLVELSGTSFLLI